ncbi:hypothetical protein BDU57DRAFT_17421 [Ampelomyces quisqualis]|uniref:Rhodopsin domain-containing protein n=1 Tax=Ampelomyces quisqualis TaxID=50730 RepID=A0A6A5QXL4_AMPQU|nr:hypothetical protein BDU57DRAFT_17421 [Ampelomyces quisqualis]
MADDSDSWVALYVCLILALTLIATRLFLRRLRHQSFSRGDYWCMAAAVFILTRLVANHFLLVYGSTRTLTQMERTALMRGPEDELSKKIAGSKLVLCTRTLLVCVLWSAKMAVLDLLASLIVRLPFELRLLYSFWAVLFATFIASIVTTFSSCAPIRLHWQIDPDPGNCVIGSAWIYTYEFSNIATDALLMALSFTLVLSVRIPKMQKFRILSLFGVGALLIAISVVRILEGRISRTQAGHTLWASLEVFFATLVAVIPTIYALVRNKRKDTGYTYDENEVTIRGRGDRTQSAVMAEGDNDKYTARIWTELEDGQFREDNTSASKILVHEEWEIERSGPNT